MRRAGEAMRRFAVESGRPLNMHDVKYVGTSVVFVIEHCGELYYTTCVIPKGIIGVA